MAKWAAACVSLTAAGVDTLAETGRLLLQTTASDDADWGEFAEFQSCPPPPAVTAPAHLSNGLSAAGGAGQGGDGFTAAPAGLLLPAAPGAAHHVSSRPAPAASPGLAVGWPVPAEPYTPVPAVLPAAKPTRFRQGLVPLPADPAGDEFAEFVAAEPVPVAAPAPTPGSGCGRAAAACGRGGGGPRWSA